MSLTPDGTRKVLSDPKTISECWLTSANYPNLAVYAADATKSDYLNDFIITACAAINEICNRKFNKQQADQILLNEQLHFTEYKAIVLENRPLISVDNVWLNVVDTFAPVSLDFLQQSTDEGIIKLVPNFSVYVQTSLPSFRDRSSTNIWIRYTSGYAKTDVPKPVKLATALYVDYLFGSIDLQAGIKSFRTQTYAQTNGAGADDPKLQAINMILKKYILRYVE